MKDSGDHFFLANVQVKSKKQITKYNRKEQTEKGNKFSFEPTQLK